MFELEFESDMNRLSELQLSVSLIKTNSRDLQVEGCSIESLSPIRSRSPASFQLPRKGAQYTQAQWSTEF